MLSDLFLFTRSVKFCLPGGEVSFREWEWGDEIPPIAFNTVDWDVLLTVFFDSTFKNDWGIPTPFDQAESKVNNFKVGKWIMEVSTYV
jgi:hypothetical protein